MDDREAMARLAGVISGIPIAMLTTVTEDGSLHSRPMATQKLPITNELLFLTGDHTGKADEVRIEHEVALTYSSAHLNIAVSGRGEISNNRAMIRALWMPIFDARFRDGPEDPEIRVLHVQVERAEYWDTTPNASVTNAVILP